MKQRNPVTKERRKSGRKVLAAVLSLAMILTLANPTTVFAAEKDGTGEGGFWSNAIESIADFFGFGDDAADDGAQTRAATAGDGVQRTADTDTTQEYTLGEPYSTQYDGRVWVDKSVSAEDEVTFGSHKVTNNSDFLVTYSALATSAVTVGQTPTDTVFILDFSTSMTWGYREDHESVAEDESRISAMITSVNHAINTLVKANPQNRIAIAVFNGASTVLLPDLTTGEDILQKVDDGTYLSIYHYDYTPGEDGGRADVRCNINGETTSTGGGTNIQAGMFAGMKILADNRDTTAEVNGKTVTRVPNVILMSDGAPTTFSSADDSGYTAENGRQTEGIITNDTNLDPDQEVQSGSWWSANSGKAIGSGDNDNPDSADGFMALLTASYYKNAISDRYYGNSGDEANIYTISFGTDVQTNAMVAMANLVLNPEENWNSDATQQTDQVQAVVEAWNRYSDGREPVVRAPIGAGNNSTKVDFRVSHPAGESKAYDPDSLFYPTQYFAAADDEQLEQIFEEIASMITSSASSPTEVTGDPINDGYITYTDTTGQYMEIKNVKTLIFMDQELNVTKDEDRSTSDRAVYVAADYNYDNPAYPGQSFNTNQIEIVVTDNADNTQTITVRVPAALIPLRTNTVTLDGNGDPTNHETSGTMPLRLCYEVGLAEGINAATLNGVDSDYIKNNSENGKVNFYSNAYTKDGQTNNGVGATVEFEPSPTNPFYFVQEDTPLYVADGVDADGNPTRYKPATGALDPDETYYVPMTYYDGAGTAVEKITTYAARSGATLTGYTANNDADNLYLKAGSPRLGNLQDVTASKSGNETGTYGNYREPTFVYDKGSTDPQNGHFLVLLGNNGKLSVPFVKKDVSLADDETYASIDGQMVGIGETLHYTIDWVNTAVDQNGDPAAGTVKISDMLPEGTTYVENSAEPDGAVYNKESNTLTWTIEAKAGESGTVEFDALVGSAAVGNEDNALPNNATITVGDNSYTTNTTVNYVPEKSVSMPDGSGGTADADGETVMPGTELTYTIEYRNTESAEATVTITDVVPDGTTFVSANPDVNPDQDGNLTWTINDVAAGATGSVSFTVKVDNSAVTTVENEATVQVGDRNPAVTNEVTTNVDRASLIIEKKVTADPGLTAPDKAFKFELTIPSKAGEQIAAVIHTEGEDDQAQNLSFDNDGKVTFQLEADQSLEIPGMGSTQYSVVEQNAANGAVNGGFTLSKVEGAAGASAEDNDQPVNDVDTATAAGTVGSDDTTVTFTNNYSVKSATTTGLGIDLGGTKNIDGRDFQTGDAFTFTIAAAQATPDAPLPQDTEVTITPASGDSAVFKFGEITFVKPGEYRYIIREVNYDTDNDDTTQNPGGIDYDAAIYRVNIVIVDNGDGTLRLATTDEIKDIATQGDLEYTSNPMVQVNKGQDSSMTEADNNAVVFTNTYNADATTASIQGTKNLTVSNSDYTLEDGDFKFTIEALGSASTDPDKTSYSEDDFKPDDSQPMPVDSKGDPVTEAVNIANGNVSFQFAQDIFTKDMIGKTFGYKITESAGDIMSSGITYDPNTSRIVWITVSDDGHGNVTAAVMPDDVEQQANNFTFNNSYEPEEITIGSQTTAGITVEKTFTGHAWTDEYEFQFKIEPVSTNADGVDVEGMPMPDGSDTISIGAPQSGTDNTGSFGEMTFSKAGEYVYKITELDDNNAGTACDDAEQTVTVKVTENKTTGKLSAEIVYEKSSQNAAFVNTYTATFDGDTAVTLNGTKNLDVADGLTYVLEDGKFTFTITPLDGAPAVTADPVGNTGSTQVADTNDWTSKIDLLNKLTFDLEDLGGTSSKTFSYVITESLPDGVDADNPTADGITYDTAAYKVDIKVTDDGKGTLSAADPLITKGTWDGGSFTAADDQSGVNGVVFTNSYAAGTLTQTPVEISKTLNGSTPEEGAFTFSMSIVSADPQDGVTLPQQHESVANDASGKVQFGDLTFSKPGTYVVEITEDIPAGATNVNVDNGQTTYENATAEQKAESGWTLNGTTYDPHSVQMTFKVKDNGDGTLVLDGNVQTTGETVFANTYAATGELTLGGTKTLKGRDWIDGDDFTFTLTGKNVSQGADENSGFTLPDPAEVTVNYNNAVAAAGEGQSTEGAKVPFSFGEITFSQTGTYEFTITESGYDDEPNVSNTSGTSVTFTYTVTDDGNGNLTATPVQASQTGTSDFVNTYDPGNATAGLTAVKTVNGESEGIAADMFTFKIEAVSAPQGAAAGLPSNAGVDGTVKNSAGGAVDFGTFTFDTEGDYVYKVTEVNEGKAGYGYDDATYTVVFHVSDDPAQGSLAATSTIYQGEGQTGTQVEAITFANTYHPEAAPATAAFSGTKSVTDEHGEFMMEAGQFSFTMTNTNAPAGVTAPTPSNGSTVSNDADGNFSFGTLTFTEPGEYTYTVSEVKPTDPTEAVEGITYDGTQYTLYFNVVDDNGTLKVETQTITSSAGGSVDAGALNFTNIYNDGQVDYQITGTKILDTNGFSGAALAEGQFSFVLVENGQVIQTVKNGTPAGNSAAFAFDPVTYTEPGTHTYTVYETGTDGGSGTGGTDSNNITYSKEAYTVTVEVSRAEGAEGEHGGLSVSADVQNKDIVFTNEYVPDEVTVGPSGDVQIGGTKTLDVADGSQREMKEGEFTFLLLEGDQEIDRVTNAADGTFAFKDITYDKAGTHYYTVSEINSGSGGIDYDPTLYSVVVEVTENTGTHELEAEVTYYNTADTETPVAGMTFTNSYEASPASANLGVVKKLDGAGLEEGQFTFTLTGSDGAPMPEKDTVTNAADGSVLFDTITFDSVGEYDYTITEVNDGQDGIIYDEDPDRTVHVSVTDNGEGNLEAKVTYGEDGAVITNTAEAAPPSDDDNGGRDNGGNDAGSSDPGNSSGGHENVQTGDTAQLFPVAAALLGAFAVMIAISVIMIRRRRK